MSVTFPLFTKPWKMPLPWPRLCLLNQRNAFWRCTTGPEAEVAE